MIHAQSRGPARVISRALMYLILLVSALLAVLPFYWTVAGSLMTPVELYAQIPHLWPAHPDFSSYTRIFDLVPMGRYFFNSLLTSGITMVVATLVSSAAGYTFAQLRFVGSRVWFVLILATLMVPYQSRVIPLFVMFNSYGLFNSYAGIVLPGLASALGLFMMTQFFKSVPPELREAALIDGASELRIFFRIYLPLARPAVATLALLMFLQSWDQLLWPLIIAPRPDMRTLQVGLAFITQYAPTLNYEMAAIVISVIPVIVAFFLAQRQFVEGIAAGAVKQ
ncbi:MAG TPA: carbohydrate ABC transporter permease [Candidatus Dormibacteraeota bacterium]